MLPKRQQKQQEWIDKKTKQQSAPKLQNWKVTNQKVKQKKFIKSNVVKKDKILKSKK